MNSEKGLLLGSPFLRGSLQHSCPDYLQHLQQRTTQHFWHWQVDAPSLLQPQLVLDTPATVLFPFEQLLEHFEHLEQFELLLPLNLIHIYFTSSKYVTGTLLNTIVFLKSHIVSLFSYRLYEVEICTTTKSVQMKLRHF